MPRTVSTFERGSSPETPVDRTLLTTLLEPSYPTYRWNSVERPLNLVHQAPKLHKELIVIFFLISKNTKPIYIELT